MFRLDFIPVSVVGCTMYIIWYISRIPGYYFSYLLVIAVVVYISFSYSSMSRLVVICIS